MDDAIDRELTQIEANEFAYFWQESGEGTYEDGLETFNEKRLKEHKEFLDYMKRKPSWNWERDADGRLRPVAIEAGLKALMSYPGFRGCRAHEARERHFTAFLAATLAAEHPEAQCGRDVRCGPPIYTRAAILRWLGIEEGIVVESPSLRALRKASKAYRHRGGRPAETLTPT